LPPLGAGKPSGGRGRPNTAGLPLRGGPSRAAGREVGPLGVVPTGVKDLICTKGIRTASGSYAYADLVPDEDDVVVERIKAAGAIVIGKTQVPEFGYSGTGQTPLAEPTCNPWNAERTSGGSSAGSGAAVATGVGPFSLGSDGGGSVRIPASFCGLYGIKPTMGRVPLYPGTKDERYPGVSGWESIEHIGPLTRTVADAALVLSVIAGYDDRDRLSIHWTMSTGCALWTETCGACGSPTDRTWGMPPLTRPSGRSSS
jgi:aspartyl-tRNA(Asn)/glutamyl-tRNA(Gln) amidotransferase subunit A